MSTVVPYITFGFRKIIRECHLISFWMLGWEGRGMEGEREEEGEGERKK